jgi:hypothetical protein
MQQADSASRDRKTQPAYQRGFISKLKICNLQHNLSVPFLTHRLASATPWQMPVNDDIACNVTQDNMRQSDDFSATSAFYSLLLPVAAWFFPYASGAGNRF